MELMYPVVTIICFIFAMIICFGNLKKQKKYTEGKKVANTKYIKETEYYKLKVKKYKILSNLIKLLSIICIVTASVLIARPATIQTKSEEKNNRDILIGLDVSTSQNKVNLEIIKKFKNIMSSIKGDRIGIVIYNTAPVVFCPLTEDYDYINECFETLEKQLNICIENDDYPPITYEENGEEVTTIWYGGVGTNSNERGSSLVGDGLARNIVFFSRFKD